MDCDRKLVHKACGGDKAAFATLVERHHPLLEAMCRRMLGDSLAVEDAIQEAVLQALLSLDRLRQPDRFGAWLAGIGLNICRRMPRQQRTAWSWEDLYGGLWPRDIPDLHPGPEQYAEEQELAHRVRCAVMDLPPGQRAAVLLFYLSGLTYAETASTLGIEVGTVKTRLHKARRTLRHELWTIWKEETMTVETKPVEVRIADVVRDTESDTEHTRFIVLLQETQGERGFPIWVGQTEGEAIALLLAGIETPRPLTYTFTASAVQALGGKLIETRITRLAGEVFYASAHIAGSAGRVTVDARPSDVMALALALDAPIRVEAELFATLAQSGKRSRADGEGAKEIGAIVTERVRSQLAGGPAEGEAPS